MKVILAIDGGGSRTRCLAIDRQGRLVSQSETGPSNHLLVAKEIVARSLTDVIDQTLSSGALNRDAVACVSAGLAGVDFNGAGAKQMEELFGHLGFETAVINGDMIIAHAGALELRPGVVALAGTGSVVFGVGENGKRAKVGGWGPIYGDEGSAYRIGEMSLRAAARAFDGRGPKTGLTSPLLKALGLTDFGETLSRVYFEGMQPREIAALSRVAYEVAEAGDQVAQEIFFQAGEALAAAVEAAIQQLEFESPSVKVSYQGSVIESCHLLRERFMDQLKRRVKAVDLQPPSFEPVIGAYLLGCRSVSWEIDDSAKEALKSFSLG